MQLYATPILFCEPVGAGWGAGYRLPRPTSQNAHPVLVLGPGSELALHVTCCLSVQQRQAEILFRQESLMAGTPSL